MLKKEPVEGFPKEFSAIKARDIFNYMTAVGASDEDKAEFMAEAYTERTRQKAVVKIDSNGKAKKEMKNIADGEKYTAFCLTNAKKWFKEKYPEAVIVKGKRINESTIFSSWGTPKTTTDKTTQEEEN